MGGIPLQPLFEDFELAARARSLALRNGGCIAMLDAKAHCSPRRWLRHGTLRVGVTNWALSFMYAVLGVPADRLFALYYGGG